MFTTHASKFAHITGIAVFIFGMTVAGQYAWSGEYHAAATPTKGNVAFEETTKMLDTIDSHHPVATTGTFDSPYLLDTTVHQTTELMDRVDRVAPPVIAGTASDLRIPEEKQDSTTDIIDTIDRLYPLSETAQK